MTISCLLCYDRNHDLNSVSPSIVELRSSSQSPRAPTNVLNHAKPSTEPKSHPENVPIYSSLPHHTQQSPGTLFATSPIALWEKETNTGGTPHSVNPWRDAVSVCQHHATWRCNSETRSRTHKVADSKRRAGGRSGERKMMHRKR